MGRAARPRRARPARRCRWPRPAGWATLHRLHNLTPPQDHHPKLQDLIRRALKASEHRTGRKSEQPIDLPVLEHLIATCAAGRPADLRNAALLALAFESGGRRRSELGRIGLEDLRWTGETVALTLYRRKNRQDAEPATVHCGGPSASHLRVWLDCLRAAGIAGRGPVFRRIDRWGRIGEEGLGGDGVARIVKQRLWLACRAEGLDEDAARERVAQYSAHGLRAGYMTEAGERGIPLPHAMRQSLHDDPRQAARYWHARVDATAPAASLMRKP